MLKNIFTFAVVMVLFSGCMPEIAVPSFKSDKEVFMFLVDGSGSMTEKDNSGVVKMAGARTAIRDIVSQIDTSKTNMGLIYFNQGCGRVKLGAKPDNNDPDRIIDGMNRIKPNYNTPLGNSMRISGDILRDVDKPINLIILSDGKDTCEGNPILEAKKLWERFNGRLKIYVIGYSVDSQTRQQLEQVARNGHGQYFDAKDQFALDKTMNNIVSSLSIRSKNWSDSGDTYTFKINFDPNSDVVKPQYYKQVEDLASYLKKNNYHIEVQGHSDSKGSDEANQKLSQKRADAVTEKISSYDISTTRIKSVGYGETTPIASNDTEDGRFQNRRVEAHINKSISAKVKVKPIVKSIPSAPAIKAQVNRNPKLKIGQSYFKDEYLIQSQRLLGAKVPYYVSVIDSKTGKIIKEISFEKADKNLNAGASFLKSQEAIYQKWYSINGKAHLYFENLNTGKNTTISAKKGEYFSTVRWWYEPENVFSVYKINYKKNSVTLLLFNSDTKLLGSYEIKGNDDISMMFADSASISYSNKGDPTSSIKIKQTKKYIFYISRDGNVIVLDAKSYKLVKRIKLNNVPSQSAIIERYILKNKNGESIFYYVYATSKDIKRQYTKLKIPRHLEGGASSYLGDKDIKTVHIGFNLDTLKQVKSGSLKGMTITDISGSIQMLEQSTANEKLLQKKSKKLEIKRTEEWTNSKLGKFNQQSRELVSNQKNRKEKDFIRKVLKIENEWKYYYKDTIKFNNRYFAVMVIQEPYYKKNKRRPIFFDSEYIIYDITNNQAIARIPLEEKRGTNSNLMADRKKRFIEPFRYDKGKHIIIIAGKIDGNDWYQYVDLDKYMFKGN